MSDLILGGLLLLVTVAWFAVEALGRIGKRADAAAARSFDEHVAGVVDLVAYRSRGVR